MIVFMPAVVAELAEPLAEPADADRRPTAPSSAAYAVLAVPARLCTVGRLARWDLHRKRCRHALMVDMPVIVRHQDQGALHLDHRHDQALCRRRAVI